MNITPAPIEYKLPEQLVQAIVDTLSVMPARQSRGLLNVIENLCTTQDQQRTDAAQAAQRDTIEAELKKKLEGKLDDAVHTPAPSPLPELVDPHQQTR